MLVSPPVAPGRAVLGGTYTPSAVMDGTLSSLYGLSFSLPKIMIGVFSA